MFKATREHRRSIGALLAALTVLLTLSTAASAENSLSFEETAAGFWQVPYQCPGGEIVQGTLLVQSTRDFEAPDTDDSNPTARVQFLAVCLDGSSFSWGGIIPVTITS